MLRRQLPAAIGMLIIFTVLTGVRLSPRRHGDRSDRLPRQGGGLARRGRWPGRRLLTDRPAVQRARVLPPTTVSGRRGLRRGGQLGVQPRADEPRLPRHCRRARRRLPGGERRRRRHAGAGRCRHRLGLGSRSAHLGRQRHAAGTTRRRGPGYRHRARCSSWSTTTPPAATSASSVSEGVNVLELNIALDALEHDRG